MRRLRGADGFHLYKESRTQHMHTLKVQIIDPGRAGDRDAFDSDAFGSDAFGSDEFDAYKKAFEQGVSVIPPFHWQLVRAPFDLGHPLWRYQRNLDIDYHVRRAHVPRPGGAREFEEVISQIASTGLERDRPLWQLWRVEGLEGGYFAYVTKMHHAIADGVSSAQILIDAFQDTPTPHYATPEHEWPEGEPEASRRELLRGGLVSLAVLARAFPRLLWRTVRSWSISLARMATGKPQMAAPFSAPRTRFNQPITPQRWYANADVRLADMKRVKELLGGTLNDVFVATCSGALRRYLEEHGELTAETLTGSIPVSVREAHEQRSYGNRLGSWLVALATDVADPLERYQAIQRNTAGARESFEAKDPKLLSDWQDYWWIYHFVLEQLQRLAGWLTGRPVFHVILSNVRGPSAPIYLNGARVVALRSMGPILDDAGLNFTGWSYVDTMSIGIVACREHVPDIRRLAVCVGESLGELLEAAEKQQQPCEGAGAA